MKRDPRKDPKPGDVLIYGPQWQLERVEVKALIADGQMVCVGERLDWWPFRVWLEYMAGAEVLHAAD